ncbi:DUF6993 domain-containing protein [Pseudarthrobacter sp. P1]|uniref:DUF6993 domain-containing protein n=1 Tax=Pseudarthrobacter sp. P1 TaxID=3418418 RepID=UPI003CEFB166
MTSELLPAPARKPMARLSMRAAIAAVAVAAVVGLGGCSLLPGQGGGPKPGAAAQDSSTTLPALGTAAAADSTTPVTPADQDTPTGKLAGTVREELSNLASASPKPTREQMKQAMLAAGVVPENLEISIGQTPTGLAVDAIEAAGRLDNDCVVGQVRDGQPTVVVMAVLASGRCFVGDQH